MTKKIIFMPHANIQYSQLAPEKRLWVIKNCYEKLFDLVEENGYKIAFEASGKTIEDIAVKAPEVLEKLAKLIKNGQIEPVSSPYIHFMPANIPEEVVNEFEKAISLRVIDSHWMNHISTMSHLREGVGLRGYANENPLQAYTMEGYQLFDDMLAKINKDVSIYLLKSEIRQNMERKQSKNLENLLTYLMVWVAQLV